MKIVQRKFFVPLSHASLTTKFIQRNVYREHSARIKFLKNKVLYNIISDTYNRYVYLFNIDIMSFFPISVVLVIAPFVSLILCGILLIHMIASVR